jgi:hypothetical protein
MCVAFIDTPAMVARPTGEGMAGSESSETRHVARQRARIVVLVLAVAVFVAAGLVGVAPAFAGQAAPGELHFYPCTDCHPVNPDGTSAKPIPNDFEGHEIVLEGHDALGEESAACLVCHDDPAKDPGKLKVIGGGMVDINSGDVAQVCYQCHQEKYNAWQAGVHGRDQPSCSAAGCHDPHTPGYIYAEPLLPFVGTGFQFKVLPETEPFTALPPPAPYAPTTTPTWFAVLVALGVVIAGGDAYWIWRGRRKR